MRIDIWSDVSCPWCYITKRTFELALSASGRSDAQMVLHPYQIDGERPAEPVPMLEWLAGKYGAERAAEMDKEVTAAGPRHGIAFRNATGFAVNTLDAHRLLWWAGRSHGRAVQSRLEELLFAAYFTSCADISDHDVLLSRVEQAGLDRGRAARLLASDEAVAEVRAEVRRARARGIAVVPRFEFTGGHVVEGPQEDAEVFLRALAGEAAATTEPQGEHQ
ncbi:DsbA family oxidoreductase [Streptomyces botrytidirepellens]|uniref:DsbA family oxidoreductase n=1 Tax=Streptomyces botrytidirepellens TaxID=2486417 RepID=A0A3M8W847_9ACTN|nr:DsbA family oxidoreductase [Streptomyces botrytidirepellens]RNG26288.1 DsbA family oxidoreductase [Streptomyces botrytidirepellens]